MRNLFNLQSLHFRLNALYIAIFSISVVVLGFVISYIMQNHLMEQLRAHIESNRTQLIGDYNEDGLPELQHDIKERVDSEDPDRLRYYLALPNNSIEFDKISHLPNEGWHEVEQDGQHLLLMVMNIKDGYRLGIAGELDKLILGKQAVQVAFFWAIAATLVIGVAGGIFVGNSFVKRVERLQAATRRFGEGDLKFRIQLKGNEDEFDQISSSLNSMFERIEILVSEVQRVSSNIAHDMRTPLGRVKQKIELMQQNLDSQAITKKELDEINNTVDGMLETFTALMRIAEIELGTRRSEFKLFKVNDVFESVSSAYELVVEDSGRSIKFDCDNEITIFGDKVLLVQLLVNLVENAIQHTPVNTKIRVEALQLADKRIQLIIADNGLGIRDDERAQVIKPFYKLDRSRKFIGGSGLGLSLVTAVANLHEAKTSIEDNNPGLLVRIIFPKV